MTSLHDLVGAQGKFSCPDCPKVITDQNELDDKQFKAVTRVVDAFYPLLFDQYGLGKCRELCTSLAEYSLSAILKSLTADELISLQKEFA